MAEFRMPSLGADMEAGTVSEWLVKPGDRVERGEIVAVVETDKADIEVEVFESGRIEEIVVPVGDKVPVGTVLAILNGAEAAPPAEPPAAVAPPPRAATEHDTASSPVLRHRAKELGVDLASVVGTGPDGSVTRSDLELAGHPGAEEPRPSPPPQPERPPAPSPEPGPVPTPEPPSPAPEPEPGPPAPADVRASPRARALAADRGIDLAAVAGTGPGGAVIEADVVAVSPAAAVVAEPGPPVPASADVPERAARTAMPPEKAEAMRRATGELMARSKREIPHYYLATSIDVDRAVAWLRDENARRPIAERLVPAVMLFKAVALALRDHPEMNGFYVDEGFQPSQAIHLGIAVSLRQGGLIAPALHDADRKTLDELMADLTDLVSRARAGRLRSSEMSDPTITVTNLGDQGVEEVFGVMYAPQVALVGFGRILERPWAENGMVGVRRVVRATLSADHRVSDGHRGGLFLTATARLLQKPEEL